MRSQLAIAFLVSAIDAVAAATPARCVELNGLEFVMTTDKQEYKVGEPIQVSVTWTNVGPEYLLIPNWRGPIDGPAEIVEGNKTVSEFAVYFEGKEWVDRHAAPSCKTDVGFRLESKKSLTRSYDIGTLYSFVRPGRYVLRAVQFGFPTDDKAVNAWRGRIVQPDVDLWIHE